VGVGDHIPYVVAAPPTDEYGQQQQQQQQATAKKESVPERAGHPDEINRSNGALRPDVEWYLVNQILPPISCLCEPIEGTLPGIIVEKLGLDSFKYSGIVASANVDEDDIGECRGLQAYMSVDGRSRNCSSENPTVAQR
jgi:DNA polymerase alpha subunit A